MMASAFESAGVTVFERGWLSSNGVLFDAGAAHETALVDSGYVAHAVQTVSLVRRALGARRLDRIVNTHLHSDHCGGNHALQFAFDCGVDVPSGESAKVDTWDEAALSYAVTGQRCPRFRRTGAISAGSEITLGAHRWQTIAAPGHDPASIVLYQPEFELLISADALWENGFGVVFPEIEGMAAFTEVRQTLEALSRLRVRHVIPGHGAPFDGIEAAIERAMRRLDKFVDSPNLHARYAAKVLVKFHMLEMQQQSLERLQAWCSSVRYLQLVHDEYFRINDFADWVISLIEEMLANGALARDGEVIKNQA